MTTVLIEDYALLRVAIDVYKRQGEIIHFHHGIAQGITTLDHRIFFGGDAAGGERGVGQVAHIGLRVAFERAAFLEFTDLRFCLLYTSRCV